ncbi:MAG: hypothetical protein ACYCZO_10090 [Daejeonella sp.]
MRNHPHQSTFNAKSSKGLTPGNDQLPLLNSLILGFFDTASAQAYEDHLFDLLNDFMLSDSRPGAHKADMLLIVRTISELLKGLEVSKGLMNGGASC